MKLGFALPGLLALVSCGEPTTSPAPLAAEEEQPPATYLASIDGITLGEGDRISQFRLRTWGVDFLAVCRIPADWEITAGRFGQSGRLDGEAGHGATQIMADSLPTLHDLALIAPPSEIQERESRDRPATFGGVAIVERWDGDEYRTMQVPLTVANVRLAPARNCPTRQ